MKEEPLALAETIVKQMILQQEKKEEPQCGLSNCCLLIALILVFGLVAFFWGAIKLYSVRWLRRLNHLLENVLNEAAVADLAFNDNQLVEGYDQPTAISNEKTQEASGNRQEPGKEGDTEIATIPFIKKEYPPGGAAACRFGYDQLLAKQSMLPVVSITSDIITETPIPKAGNPIDV